MSFAHVDLEGLVLLVSSIPSGWDRLPPFLTLLEEGLDGDISFMTECTKVSLSV